MHRETGDLAAVVRAAVAVTAGRGPRDRPRGDAGTHRLDSGPCTPRAGATSSAATSSARRPDPRDRPYRFIIRLALVVFRLFRFRFDVRGSEHVPTTGGAIICSNHVSFFDFTFLGLGALPQHRLVRFMAKSAVFDHWFAGRFMRAMQHIPVDRQAGAAAFESAVRALKDGKVVGVFPEATISTSFTVKDLKAGVARMAVDAGVPIIPAAVWGGHRIATKGPQGRPAPRRPVTVILGEPIVAEPGEKAQSLLAAPGPPWRPCSTRPSAATPTSPPDPTTAGGCPPPRRHRAHARGGRGQGRRPRRRARRQGPQAVPRWPGSRPSPRRR